MDYEEFDIGNFEDKLCKAIIGLLRTEPMTVHQLSKLLFNDEWESSKLSPKLQKLKNLGMVSNVKDSNNICYWGVEKKYRK